MKALVKAHATLGASSCARWWACPGSVVLSEAVGEKYESAAAREGTAAHALAEVCLRITYNPFGYVGQELEGVVVDEEMAEGVAIFVDYCRRTTGYRWGIEEQFDLESLNPPAPMYGTADFWTLYGSTLEVVDLKYGRGVVVEVLDNKQLLYYALGAVLKTQTFPTLVKVTIVQPRAGHSDGVIRSFEVDLLELMEFAVDLLDHARATQAPDAPRIPGTHCRWCPASGKCPEQREAAMLVAQGDFDVPPNPLTLPEDVLFDMLPKVHILEDFLAAIKQRGEALMRQGVEIPGMKMVARRARRQWVDEQATRAWLDAQQVEPEEYETRDLRSVAQIEKVFKKIPPELVERVETGFKMVPERDPSPKVAMLKAEDEFEVLTAGPTED